jgi:hypothetical protein
MGNGGLAVQHQTRSGAQHIFVAFSHQEGNAGSETGHTSLDLSFLSPLAG